MNKLAIMPLEDYQNACNTIRNEMGVDIKETIVEKYFYTERENFTEKLMDGILVDKKEYEIFLNDFTSSAFTNGEHLWVGTVGIINVPSFGETLGIKAILQHPAGENTWYDLYIYQNNTEIMLYVHDYPSQEGYITISQTSTITSGDLSFKIQKLSELKLYEGYTSGETDGYGIGYQEGYTDGETQGYLDGKTQGYLDGEQSVLKTLTDVSKEGWSNE